MRGSAIGKCLVLFVAGVLSWGCGQHSGERVNSDESPPPSDIPIITAIGEHPTITFEKGKSIRIPFEGINLSDPKLALYFSVTGTVPIQGGDVEFYRPGQTPKDSSEPLAPSHGLIVLSSKYSESIQSGDMLTVNVSVIEVPADLSLLKEAISGLDEKTGEAALRDRIALMQAAVRRMADRLGPAYVEQLNSRISQLQAALETKTWQHTMIVAEMKKIGNDVGKWVIAPRVSANPADASANTDVMATGSRQFELLSVDDYRSQFVAGHFAINEITATPLSEKDTKTLFGSLIADRFFVVSTTLTNNSTTDRLVSTGMITAYGRALVETSVDSGWFKTHPWIAYTIPVKVAPISREHAYAILADEKPYFTREWVFRGLELSGTVAEATINGFAPGSTDLLRMSGLYGNVLLPGLKAFWPDPVPAQLQNIVNFALPEFVKVPGHGGVGYKYLFFSKKELQGMISDPTLFTQGVVRDHVRYNFDPATVKIVYLSFDTLLVPYDNVVGSGEQSVAGRAERALNQIDGLLASAIDELTKWDSDDADDSGRLWGTLTLGDLKKVKSIQDKWLSPPAESVAATLLGSSDAKVKEAATHLQADMKDWKEAIGSIVPNKHKNGTTGLTRLQASLIHIRHDLQLITSEIQGGRTADLYSSRVKADEDDLAKVVKQIEADRSLAEAVQKIASDKDFTGLDDANLPDDDASTIEDTLGKVSKLLADQKKTMPGN